MIVEETFSLSKKAVAVMAGFYVNLTQARVTWREGILIEKMLLLQDWPIHGGSSSLRWHPWAGGPGCIRKQAAQVTRKQRSSMASVSSLPLAPALTSLDSELETQAK